MLGREYVKAEGYDITLHAGNTSVVRMEVIPTHLIDSKLNEITEIYCK